MSPAAGHRPPKMAEWLLDHLLDDAGCHTPLGDFQEFFSSLTQARGLAKARRWYWAQILSLIPKKLAQQGQQGGGMLKNHAKMTFRHFSRQRGYSLINLLGLALGMTVAILTLLWVRDEKAFDRFHANGKNLYRVVTDWSRYDWKGLDMTPAPLAEVAKAALPEIQAFSRFRTHNRKVFRVNDRFFYESRGIFVDPAFFEMFSFPCVEGEAVEGLKGPDDVLITQSLARKYFGEASAVGQVVLADGRPLTVRGVLADVPRHSTLQFDYVQNFAHVRELNNDNTSWGACQFTTFMLLGPQRDLTALSDALTEVAKKNGSSHAKSGASFRFQPIRDMHLDARSYSLATVALGDRRLVTLFTAIALFAVVIAAINFINLSTARAMLRSKEVGLRKTVGARRGQLVLQFLGESLTYAGASLMVAILASALLLPSFNHFMDTDLSLRFNDGGLWMIFAGLLGVTGLLAGFYPAVLLSGFRPAAVLKNQTLKGGGMRKALVVFQFTLAIVLMIGMVTASEQIRYMMNRNLKMDKENVLLVPLKDAFATDYDRIKAELLAMPGIVSVSGVWNNFTTDRWGGAYRWRFEGMEQGVEQEIDIIVTGIDYDFFETLKIPLLAGRPFTQAHGTDQDQALIFNQAAIDRLGMTDPVGKWFQYDKNRYTVIGVAEDVPFRNAQQTVEPRVYFIYPMAQAARNGMAVIRLSGQDRDTGLASVETLWKRVNSYTPLEYLFLTDQYETLYHRETQVGRMLSLLTGLATLISCLGLFGLASFIAQRRTKEMGVRKVLGASESGLWALLSGQFVRWVALSNLAAWPLGYWLIGKMLAGYAYRIPMHWTLFLLPGLAALIIALFTVSLQARRAATVQQSRPCGSSKFLLSFFKWPLFGGHFFVGTPG